ncbi:MAG: hypothetical protein HY695_22520 [Deltaproteobacteria bacterium]|nr:hypothetical protein [Deltaproteobacteria bacterium]
MLNRFSLYDFIAILFPGIFFLWALAFFVDAPLLQHSVPLSGGIADTSVLIVIGYVTGLLLQGVSQLLTERILLYWWGGFPSARWLLPDSQRFTPEFKMELSAILLRKFNISLELDPAKSGPKDSALKRNQEIFYRCYRAVEKLSDLPQTFNAQYGLFRSLLTTFALLVTAGVWTLWPLHRSGLGLDAETVLTLGLFILGAIISYYRAMKRGEDFARAVYDVFIANFASQ